jgi:hypothetical protein
VAVLGHWIGLMGWLPRTKKKKAFFLFGELPKVYNFSILVFAE